MKAAANNDGLCRSPGDEAHGHAGLLAGPPCLLHSEVNVFLIKQTCS